MIKYPISEILKKKKHQLKHNIEFIRSKPFQEKFPATINEVRLSELVIFAAGLICHVTTSCLRF